MTTPKALREMCEQVLASGLKSAAAKTIARWALDRLSGEAVTRDIVHAAVTAAVSPFNATEPNLIERVTNALVSLLPAGMDRNAEIERCAKWCEMSLAPRSEMFATHVRMLKEIPEWEPPV